MTETPGGTGESGSEPTEIVFEESEVEPIIASPPSYRDVIVFEESEVEPIIGNPPAYGEVVFEESEVEPIIGWPPGYGEVVFEESEVEPIIGRRYPPPQRRQPSYDAVVSAEEVIFEESEVEPIVVPGRRSPSSQLFQVPDTSWPPLVRQPLRRGYISFELDDAWDLPRPSGMYAGLSQAELQVLSWLQVHSSEIAEAERKWKIDRRAIAAAIAWEALVNVWPASIRAVGPGKVHYASSVVRQVEDKGYLPKRSEEERRTLLKTPSGAIEYIGAIMAALADVAASFGHNIRCNVPILTNQYVGSDLEQWRARLASREAGTPLQPGNPMGIWSRENLAYVELGVGTPDRAICSGP